MVANESHLYRSNCIDFDREVPIEAQTKQLPMHYNDLTNDVINTNATTKQPYIANSPEKQGG